MADNKKIKYSYSRISTYKSCPLKYKFAYLDKIERDTENIEAFVGNRVHEVLQKLYTDIKICKVNSLDELLAFYNKSWEKNWHDNMRIIKNEYSTDNYRDLGIECIKRFYDRYHPFDQAITIGTELQVDLSLADERPANGSKFLYGYVDRLDQKSDGCYEIHDYKTSTTLPSQDYLDSDEQLAIYQLAIKNRFNDAEDVDLVWHFLVFDKELRSKRTDEQLDDLKGNLIETIKKIEATTAFDPIESALCEWCEYRDLCPKRKHYVKVDSLPQEEFEEESGVALVNKYVLLEAKKKEVKEFLERVDSEIEGVKQALVNYAKQEGLDIVKGVDKKARIKTETKYAFPAKNNPLRFHLDKLIREAGKWDEVSDLNPWILSKVIQENKWDKELLENIKTFGEEKQSVSVWLANLSSREKVSE